MTDRLHEIRSRWQRLADVPIKGNLDFARLGEQARVDVPVLLELLQERPSLGYVVLSRNPDSGRLQPQGRVHAETGLAQNWQRHLESAPGPRITIRPGTQFLVAEIREVQP